eukprot:PhF_6_TR33709/c0_g1_i2/m.49468
MSMFPDEDGLLPSLDPPSYLLRKEVQRRISGQEQRIPSEMIITDSQGGHASTFPRPPLGGRRESNSTLKRTGSLMKQRAMQSGRRQSAISLLSLVEDSDAVRMLLGSDAPKTARTVRDKGVAHIPLDLERKWAEHYHKTVPITMTDCETMLQVKGNQNLMHLMDKLFECLIAYVPALEDIASQVRNKAARAMDDLQHYKHMMLRHHFKAWQSSSGEQKANPWKRFVTKMKGEIEEAKKAKDVHEGYVKNLVEEVRRMEMESKKLQQERDLALKQNTGGKDTAAVPIPTPAQPALTVLAPTTSGGGAPSGTAADIERLTNELRRALQSTKQTGEKLREEQTLSKKLKAELDTITAERDELQETLRNKSRALNTLRETVSGQLRNPDNEKLIRVLDHGLHILNLGDAEENVMVEVLKTVASSMTGITLPILTNLGDPEVNLVYYAATLYCIDKNIIDGGNVIVAAKLRDVHQLQGMVIRGLDSLGIGSLVDRDDLLLPIKSVHYALAGAMATLWLHSLVLNLSLMTQDDPELEDVISAVLPWRHGVINVIGMTVSSALRGARRTEEGLRIGISEAVCEPFAKLSRAELRREVTSDSDFEEIQSMICSQSYMLKSIFHYYGSIADQNGENPFLCVTPSDVYRLMSDCRLDKKTLTRESIRSFMQSMTIRFGKSPNMELPGIAFPEIIVRSATLRFSSMNVVTAVRQLLNSISHWAGRVQQELLKDTFLYDGNMREVRKEIGNVCLQPFKERSNRDVRYSSRNAISFNMFCEIFDDMKVVDEHLTHVVLQSMYTHAQDYTGDSGKPMVMTFHEFIFAFVCVGLYKFSCPYWPMHLRVLKFLDQIRDMGVFGTGTYSTPVSLRPGQSINIVSPRMSETDLQGLSLIAGRKSSTSSLQKRNSITKLSSASLAGLGGPTKPPTMEDFELEETKSVT